MSHIKTTAGDLILDCTVHVLDKGFVRLVDYMGGDDRIVQAARVAYGKGTKSTSEDAALIDYLMRHRHTSPFEQVEFAFHMKLPIFCARQIVRHRTASLNEMSGRYSIMGSDMYLPLLERMMEQSSTNKQGSGNRLDLDVATRLQDDMKEDQDDAYSAYECRIEDNLTREVARINLPLSTYTEWYWKIDLHNLFHCLSLRMDPHAQWETRQYANAMWGMVKAVCPIAAKSFETHVLNAATFTADEFRHLKKYLNTGETGYTGTMHKEFVDKMIRLNKDKDWMTLK